MLYEIPETVVLYVLSEDGTYSSRIIGFEADECLRDEIMEVMTEYGSVPASPALMEALAKVPARVVAVAR